MRSFVKMTCLAAMILIPSALLSVASPESAATPRLRSLRSASHQRPGLTSAPPSP